jgi:UDP-N-acetylglucosamine--N-acetylmuramyl-(pentapeptide) pyrophosphoryl-undecaprenol N-acetylglucosamine transferase
MTARRVVICGGGTGGHLFPALVLGRTLREKDPSIEVTFIGSDRAEERALMARHGVPFIALRVEGLKGRGIRSLKGLALLPFALLRSFRLLRQIKPDLVVGVGSYSSGTVVVAASRLKIPILLLEQNVIPGFTNRRLLGRARKVAVAFEASLPYLKGKGVFLGNPVRPEFAGLPRKSHDGLFDVLVFGGSQGSHFLNVAVTAALPFLSRWKDRLRIVHQTGKADLRDVRRSYTESGFPESVVEAFFDDMAERFAAADLVIARAGATTCAELIAARKASILVPFAGAADDHQRKNAEALVDVGGADIILESDGTPQRFAATLGNMIEHPERLSAMENNLASLAVDDSAGKIATLALTLMNRRT